MLHSSASEVMVVLSGRECYRQGANSEAMSGQHIDGRIPGYYDACIRESRSID